MCPVCDNRGWLDAAPVSGLVFREIESQRPLWALAVRVPCWSCYPNNLNLLTA